MWQPYERFRYWGFYGQDDFHVTPRFTLNLGIRYDIYGLMSTRQKPLSNFCLGCLNPLTGLKGKMIYVGDPDWPGHGTDVAPPNWNDLGPRVNFSWAPFADRKTVIRGGYDIFYSNALAGVNAPGQGAANAPGWNQEYDWRGSWNPAQCAPFSQNCPAFRLSDTTTNKAALTTPPLPNTFPALERSPLLGAGVMQLFVPPPHDPMVQMWSFEIERQLPANMAVRVGYVGNHGAHLLGPGRSYNYVHTSDLLKYQTSINANIPIGQVYSDQTAALLAQVWGAQQDQQGNFVLLRTLLLRDYPFFDLRSQGMGSFANYDGTSIYHSLNVALTKKSLRGLSLYVDRASQRILSPWSQDFVDLFGVRQDYASARKGLLEGVKAGVLEIQSHGWTHMQPDLDSTPGPWWTADLNREASASGWYVEFEDNGAGKRFQQSFS